MELTDQHALVALRFPNRASLGTSKDFDFKGFLGAD